MRFVFCVLIAVLCADTLAAATNHVEYVGSLAKYTGSIRYRDTNESGKSEGELLSAKDEYRNVYTGDQVRSLDSRGKVTVYLPGGKIWLRNLTDTNWVDIGHSAGPEAAKIEKRKLESGALAGFQQGETKNAGSDRGNASARRALLVGVNDYGAEGGGRYQVPGALVASAGRGDWSNLKGCVNDVEGMRSLLLTRFGFKPENIVVLTNQMATRQGILDSFKQHLIEAVSPGDISFFYYAGHGSQVTNSLSPETDKMDESIVPADSKAGAADIRDKELRRLMNAALNRGARVTAIFDSCHSGSISRGPFDSYFATRHLPPSRNDAADGSSLGPDPKTRGALILSASLDTQPAAEQQESDNRIHGAFSTALAKVLSAADQRIPVERLFLSVRALLQAEGRLQEPVIDSGQERMKLTLFGEAPDDVSTRTVVAVEKIERDGSVIIQGGRALGLSKGCELTEISDVALEKRGRLSVINVLNMASARATVLKDTERGVKPGDLYEISRWTAPAEGHLKVWLPPAWKGAASEIRKIAGEISGGGDVEWVADPVAKSPDWFASWNGGSWKLRQSSGGDFDLGPEISSQQLLAVIKAHPVTHGRAGIYIQVPPSENLLKLVKQELVQHESIVELVAGADEANYLLASRMNTDGKLEYAWVSRGASTSGTQLTPMPKATTWQRYSEQSDSTGLAAGLMKDLSRLGKVKAWLTMETPADDGAFPYRLVVMDDTLTKDLTDSPVSEGDVLKLVLRADPKMINGKVAPRYVYVFVLDSLGQGTLIFPQGGETDEARLPAGLQGDGAPTEIVLKMARPISVAPPFGVDAYIILTTETPIPNPGSNPGPFNFEGFQYNQLNSRGSGDPLAELIGKVGVRGVSLGGSKPQSTPVNWSIQKVFMKSVAK